MEQFLHIKNFKFDKEEYSQKESNYHMKGKTLWIQYDTNLSH